MLLLEIFLLKKYLHLFNSDLILFQVKLLTCIDDYVFFFSSKDIVGRKDVKCNIDNIFVYDE